MASNNLGKRSRHATSPVSLPPSKRQARAQNYYDEENNPFLGPTINKSSNDEVPKKADRLPRSALTRSTPTTRTLRNRTVMFDKEIIEGKSKVKKKVVVKDESSPAQNPTPQTPRHRDAFSKKVPVTPRHRITLNGTSFTPRTPMTPGGSIITIYSQARQIFSRSSEPGQLVGRDEEREKLVNFIANRISKNSGGCIYISGPAGTGKSAMVGEVTKKFETSKVLKKLYINCMSITASSDLYDQFLEAFCSDIDVYEGQEVETLQSLFVPQNSTKISYIVTLDEIDHILSLDLNILYKLFEWALQKKTHLILLGIANALDLTDRFLPRLKAHDLRPEVLPFLPYTAHQIKEVITTRLRSLIPTERADSDFVPFMHPSAIELCSRKVSSQSGDLRKAFDICRRAIDMIELQTKQRHEQALSEDTYSESPLKNLTGNLNIPSCQKTISRKSLVDSLGKLTFETAPRASISHVNKITSLTFGNGANHRLRSLNLQQKAALCALVALEKRKREAPVNVMATPSKTKDNAPSIKALYDVYCTLCKHEQSLHPLTSIDFKDIISSLETLSLVTYVDKRCDSSLRPRTAQSRMAKFGTGLGVGERNRIKSCVGEEEISQALEGFGGGILQNILKGEGLD
ncbi:BgTH12-05777 [Blumeria graminis f. sp. triticale]|uniref:Cell division control protein n=4 Tax=Blumeria graminis TaxID=34373 RepID=A0A9X9QEI4_BLUGR|nr:BgTH12-05777 [Blumeria graminis f. sp. triticale]VDB90774.1 Bgt-4428-2 [Blumeria graminis f. sp. tritici]